MNIMTKNGIVLGTIGVASKKDDKAKIAEEFRRAILGNIKEDVQFPVTVEHHKLKEPEGFGSDKYLYSVESNGTIIAIPKGGWSIMDKLTDEILENIPGPIVEIGAGGSTEIFAKHAIKHDRELYTCDLKMGGMFSVFDGPLFDKHTCFIGKSEDFIKEFKGNPSVVFIDGQHTYKTVKMETDFFLDKLATWGVIFFHDMFPHQERLIHDEDGIKPGTAYKMRQELERNPEVDVFTWPYTALNVGLTMVMKHFPNEERGYWLKNGRKSGGDDEVN